MLTLTKPSKISLSTHTSSRRSHMARKKEIGQISQLLSLSDPSFRVISITGDGMAGKTTFIQNDVKPLITDRHKGKSKSKELADRYDWVYVELDYNNTLHAKVDALLAIYLELARQGYAAPRFAAALERLSRLWGKSSFANGRYRDLRQSAVLDDVATISDGVLLDGTGDSSLVAKARDALQHIEDSAVPAEALAPLRDLVGGNALFLILAAFFPQGMSLAASISTAHILIDLVDRVCKAGDFNYLSNQLIDQMGISELEEALSTFLTVDLELQIEKAGGRRPLIVLDGLEGAIEYSGKRGRLPWLERLIRSSQCLFILVSRRRLVGIQDIEKVVQLHPIEESEFNRLLHNGRLAPLDPLERKLYCAGKELPGLLALYAGTVQDRGLLNRFALCRRLANSVAAALKTEDHKDSLDRDEELRFQTQIWIERLYIEFSHGVSDAETQVLSWLAWFPFWDSAWVYNLIPPAIGYTEAMRSVRLLPFVESVDATGCRIHPRIAPIIRHRTANDTINQLKIILDSKKKNKVADGGANACAACIEIGRDRLEQALELLKEE